MLDDPATWKNWSRRDRTRDRRISPQRRAAADHRGRADVAATSPRSGGTRSKNRPMAGTEPGFDDRDWKEGPGGFGTKGTPGIVIGTDWNTPDIWLRREVTLPAGSIRAIAASRLSRRGRRNLPERRAGGERAGIRDELPVIRDAPSGRRAAEAGWEPDAGRALSSDGGWPGYRRGPGGRGRERSLKSRFAMTCQLVASAHSQ